MTLLDILIEKTICADLKATDRDKAIGELLELLVEAGQLSQDQSPSVMKAILDREAMGSTAIGRGVAVPHARSDSLSSTIMSLGLSSSGVDFHALDGEPVHAIFLVVGPGAAPNEYLAVMEKLSKLIRNSDFRRFLRRADTSREVLELIEEMGT